MRVISEQTGLRKADLELVETYEATGGETYRYQFYEHEGDKLVSRDDLDAVFKVSNSQFSTVAELDFSNTQMADLDAQESLISEQEETDG
jgi:hypothetical protein